MLFDFLWLVGAGTYAVGSGLNQQAKQAQLKKHFRDMGYNRERQRELEQQMDSYYPVERAKFAEALGRPFNNKCSYYEKKQAVKEIAEKEGWRYFDLSTACNNVSYRRIVGSKW